MLLFPELVNKHFLLKNSHFKETLSSAEEGELSDTDKNVSLVINLTLST
jgi:hypothetical protein